MLFHRRENRAIKYDRIEISQPKLADLQPISPVVTGVRIARELSNRDQQEKLLAVNIVPPLFVS